MAHIGISASTPVTASTRPEQASGRVRLEHQQPDTVIRIECEEKVRAPGISVAPSKPMIRNQTIMTGPAEEAGQTTLCMECTRKRPSRIASVSGMT